MSLRTPELVFQFADCPGFSTSFLLSLSKRFWDMLQPSDSKCVNIFPAIKCLIFNICFLDSIEINEICILFSCITPHSSSYLFWIGGAILVVLGAHLSVTSTIRSFTRWPGPVAVMGMPVGVVVAIRAVALLVHGAVMVMVAMVVTTILGAAAVPLTLLGRQVAGLCGGAEVCAQA